MSRYAWVIVSWGLLLAAAPAWTRTVIFDGTPIDVRLEYGQPTSITFPEAVEVVSTATDSADLTVTIEDRTVLLQPRVKKLSGRLIVQTVMKQHYQVQFTVASPADMAIEVQFPAPPPLPQRLGTGESQPPQSLVRALLITMWTTGHRPPQAGVMVQPSQRVLAQDTLHRVRVLRVYQAPPYYGYTLELENRLDRPWPLFLPQLEDDGLLVSAAEPIVLPGEAHPPAEVIPPRGRALLHLIYHGGR